MFEPAQNEQRIYDWCAHGLPPQRQEALSLVEKVKVFALKGMGMRCRWESQGYFRPSEDTSAEPFTICAPRPHPVPAPHTLRRKSSVLLASGLRLMLDFSVQ